MAFGYGFVKSAKLLPFFLSHNISDKSFRIAGKFVPTALGAKVEHLPKPFEAKGFVALDRHPAHRSVAIVTYLT